MWAGAVVVSTAFCPNGPDRSHTDDCHSVTEDILNLTSDSFFVKWKQCFEKVFQAHIGLLGNLILGKVKPPGFNEIIAKSHFQDNRLKEKLKILSLLPICSTTPLLKWKPAVIHVPSVGATGPWEPSAVNTALNAWLVSACDPLGDSQTQHTQTQYLHAPPVVFTLAFASAMKTSGCFHPIFTSKFGKHVKATIRDNLEQKGRGNRRTGGPTLGKGDTVHRRGRRVERRDSCKNECR